MAYQSAVLLYCVLASASFAPAAQLSARDAANPAAATPGAVYESAFAGYRSFRDEPVSPWRELNEEVAKVGGHGGVLKNAPKAASAAVPSTKPAPADGHAGH